MAFSIEPEDVLSSARNVVAATVEEHRVDCFEANCRPYRRFPPTTYSRLVLSFIQTKQTVLSWYFWETKDTISYTRKWLNIYIKIASFFLEKFWYRISRYFVFCTLQIIIIWSHFKCSFINKFNIIYIYQNKKIYSIVNN